MIMPKGTNVSNIVTGCLEGRDQGEVRCNVAGCAAAGENNCFHKCLHGISGQLSGVSAPAGYAGTHVR